MAGRKKREEGAEGENTGLGRVNGCVGVNRIRTGAERKERRRKKRGEKRKKEEEDRREREREGEKNGRWKGGEREDPHQRKSSPLKRHGWALSNFKIVCYQSQKKTK